MSYKMAANKKISSLVEFLLKLINSIFFMFAVATLLYGLYFLFKWKHDQAMKSHSQKPKQMPPAQFLLAFAASNWLFEQLPTPWFVFFIMAIGATLVFVSCFGFIGTAVRSRCCLCFYIVLLVGFILAQLGIEALMFFGHDSNKDLPTDKTGTLLSTYRFLDHNWKIVRWADLAILTLEVIALFLALYLLFLYKGSNDRDPRERIIRSDYLRRAAARPSNTKTSTPAPHSTGPSNTKTSAPAPPSTGPSNTKTSSPAPPSTGPSNTKTSSPAPPSTRGSNTKTSAPAPPSTRPSNTQTSAPAPPSTRPSNTKTSAPAPPSAGRRVQTMPKRTSS